MFIENIKIYGEDKKFHQGYLRTHEDLIVEVNTDSLTAPSDLSTNESVMDGGGAYVIPGLIDMHFHGAMGADFCDGSEAALRTIAQYEASVGVTAIAPATMTLPIPALLEVLKTAANTHAEALTGKKIESSKPAADLVGINMEGPFISRARCGAQDPDNIMACDVGAANAFLEASKGLVKVIGIAPEASTDSKAFIKAMKDKVIVSLAHTDADYEDAVNAFDAGASHVVHMFNAMQGLHHREPGLIPAALEHEDVTVELICDGIHVHPAMIRLAFSLFGADRICLISDSMRATGLGDGQYTLGGLDVKVEGRRATLVTDGALAGSVTNLMDCLRFAVTSAKIPLEQAVYSATATPAKRLGIFDQYGSIKANKKADLVLLEPDLQRKAIIKDGRIVI